jgi:nucleoside-diphosphate-sugar epimerase
MHNLERNESGRSRFLGFDASLAQSSALALGDKLSIPRFDGLLLITGGTGFIGGAVLDELCDTEVWPNVLIFVRALTLFEGRQRILQSIRRFRPEFPSDELLDTQIILGDLHGLAEVATDARLEKVAYVIHSAAVTSFSSAERIANTNVDASLAFVSMLVERSPLKRFVNVGTAWSVGFVSDAVVLEGEGARSDVHFVPYTKSKADFERLARHTFAKAPFVSVRPSIVVGHTRFGTEPSGSIYWVFRAAAILGAFTCRLEDRIDVVPVDWVARSLIQIATAEQLNFDSYHLSSGRERASCIGDLDKRIARVRGRNPWGREWREVGDTALLDIIRNNKALLGRVNPRLLHRALILYGRFAQANTFFDNTRTLLEGIAPPPPFHTYVERCATTAESSELGKQMADDFK